METVDIEIEKFIYKKQINNNQKSVKVTHGVNVLAKSISPSL